MNYGQPSAVLWKDQLFVADGRTPDGRLRVRALPWNFCDCSEAGMPLTDRIRARGMGSYAPRSCQQAKMEIQGDRLLWFTAGSNLHIIPLSELPYLEQSTFGQQLCLTRADYQEQYLLFGSYTGFVDQLLFPKHRKPDIQAPPLADEPPDVRAEYILGWRESDYVWRGRFNVQIAGPKSVRLFHAFKDTLFVSIEPDYLSNWYSGIVKRNRSRRTFRSRRIASCERASCPRTSRSISRCTRRTSVTTS